MSAFIIDNLFAAFGGLVALAIYVGLSYAIAPKLTKDIISTIFGRNRK